VGSGRRGTGAAALLVADPAVAGRRIQGCHPWPSLSRLWNRSTRVLAPKPDEPPRRAALKAGHADVAHDRMCEAIGFRFEALGADGKPAGIMGDALKHADGLKLSAQFPLACQTRRLRNSVQVAETAGQDRAELAVREAGVYRLEAWLTVAGEPRPGGRTLSTFAEAGAPKVRAMQTISELEPAARGPYGRWLFPLRITDENDIPFQDVQFRLE